MKKMNRQYNSHCKGKSMFLNLQKHFLQKLIRGRGAKYRPLFLGAGLRVNKIGNKCANLLNLLS